jgi:Uma2 family endonuclease
MGHPAEKANGRYSYADYSQWPDEERRELIHGEAFAMTPAPSRAHQKISVALVSQFYQQLTGKPCEVYCAPFDVRLPVGSERDEDIYTVVQPDLVIVCDSSKLDERGCKGAPDLVVEIVSPQSARMDLKIKLSLYEKAGVKEYWVVQPTEKIVMVFNPGANGEFGKPSVYSQEDIVPIAVLGGLAIDMQPVLMD